MSRATQPANDTVRPVNLKDALSERYLAYALSTITARSLPDVRDGLKPVQRRLLYAMLQLRLDPQGGFKKCARVVGDVIGKFHPHGDAAVYDALVRLAQDFAQRYPLVDGQGNFGNIDGDNPAAMRYTESRLTTVAMALLDGIDEDAVDFRDNYDGSDREPVVLPAAFPNLLANGASGIAVGMATSIPPHNAGELLSALAWMAGRAATALQPTAEELLKHIKGPDLPTGGILIEPETTLLEAYRTGRGSFRLRARWEKEDLPYGQYQIVVTEIPYQVQKSRLVERIAELLGQKKLPLLGDLRDESTEAVRLVLVPKSRSVPPELLMEQLFRTTDLEVRLPLNMNVLDAAGTPRVMSLAEVLSAYLAHRMEVLVRRSRYRLAKVEDRLEVLEGYLKAFLDLDEVIRIIREEDEPKPALMARFDLTERQAEAILNLRLRNLRKLEEMELRGERERLAAERQDLLELLADESKRRARLKEEFQAARKQFGGGALGRRRTTLAEAPVVSLEALEEPVERYPVTVVCSRLGWIRAMRGTIENPAEIKYKEGDSERFVLRAQSSDKLMVVAGNGRVYTLAVDKLPSGRGHGEPISLSIDLEKGVEILDLRVVRPDGRLVFATRKGFGFVAEEKEIEAQTRAGRQVVNLAEGDSLLGAFPVEGDHVALAGSNHKLLVFPLAELPVQARGKGVTLMKLKDAELADLKTFDPAQGLTWAGNGNGKGKRLADVTPWRGARATTGRMAPPGFPKSHRFG
ncbi:DNA topoisomerase IV subunit A [Benzoatithermus flavus]|uniref:DNA topoisomerase 4 subunit A n=1 Tax=Benzoatithermus flavus TaxID=3108223 RepID=A0ABU8XTG5_9PROT